MKMKQELETYPDKMMGNERKGKQTISFLTFGNKVGYQGAVTRICVEAKAMNVFDEIKGLTEEHLQQTDFWDKHGSFVRANPKGYGYWLWKPYIVLEQLQQMEYDDILVYADAGCVLNPKGKQRLNEYFAMANDNEIGVVAFQQIHEEQSFTKMDTLHHLHALDLATTSHLVGGIFVVRKTQKSVELFKRIYETCSHYHLLDNSPSILPNSPNFKDHRHDQSIFSILVKQSPAHILPNDETYFGNWDDGASFPILAKRWRG